MSVEIVQADCLEFLTSQPADSVDLVLGSPPYVDARTYGRDDVSRDPYQWVDWMLQVTEEAVRVSRGLVIWVAAGVQRESVYWPACEGLQWEWWKRGGHLWCPAVWWKVDVDDGGTGIPGSGGNVPGRRWLRKDWEYCMCFKKPGLIPYDHPEVMGHEPVYDQVGGEMSNRTVDGQRINAAAQAQGKRRWGGSTRSADGEMQPGSKDGARKKVCSNRGADGKRKSNKPMAMMDVTQGHDAEGNLKENGSRPMPKIANPGNCIIVKARVGGGHMGSTLCHESEAPYPENLAEFFVMAYSPPGGTVLDCFSGSGTTAAVSVANGRNFVGCDLRQSQVDLSLKRLANVTPDLFSGATP